MNTSPRSYLIITNQGQTLPPFKLTQSKHILGRDPQIADLLVPEDWGIISRCQATLIEHQGTYIIYDGDRHQPSSNRLFINNHLITHDNGYSLQNGDVIKIGQNINILRFSGNGGVKSPERTIKSEGHLLSSLSHKAFRNNKASLSP